MQLKRGVRILALNGAPFRKGAEGSERVIGIIGRQGSIEGALSFKVEIDGTDSTEQLIKSVKKSRFSEQIKLIAVNGITVGGLNILDFERIAKELDVGIVGITRRKPRSSLLKKALTLDPKRRQKLEIIERTYKKVEMERMNSLYAQCLNVETVDVKKMIDEIFSLLRTAHIISSGIELGESRGRI